MNFGKWEMPYGKHRGKMLEDIPGDYLLWLFENNPPPQVVKYVEVHRKTLEEEKRESGRKYQERYRFR